MLVRESEEIGENISVGEREDPSHQQSLGHGSMNTKDDLITSFLSDIRNDMQVTHKLLAQIVAQGDGSAETSSSQADKQLGGKHTAMMHEAAVLPAGVSLTESKLNFNFQVSLV